VLTVESELLAKSKERFLVASKTSIPEKIIGFKFGMDDRNADVVEATKNVKMVEEEMKRTDLQISEIKMKVRDFVSVL
jgi:AAA15 family ATPase/GTPase